LLATLAIALTLLMLMWIAGQARAAGTAEAPATAAGGGAAGGADAPATETGGSAAAGFAGTAAARAALEAGDHPAPAAQTEHVVIYDQKKYWEVHLDVNGATPYQIGYEYGQAVMDAMPSYARWAWAYLTAAHIFFVDYDLCAARAKVLKQNLPDDVQQQIEGMAAGIKKAGGGFWIDKTACYVMTVFPDVGRDTQCSALCAWGSRTTDGQPVIGRILDWTTAILPRLNSVTVFHDGDKSFASIGFLGGWSVISGLNDDGVFGAILDAPTGRPYPKRKDLATRRSYPTDLGEALANAKTIAEAAAYLQAPRDYCFSHQILLGDKTGAAILENDLTGVGPYSRQLRDDQTPLTAGVTWGFKDAVCAVNSFVAQGNECDHFKDKWNTDRWSAYKAQMNTLGAQITPDKLKKMLGYGSAKEGAYPYNDMSVQVMVFEPAVGKLQVGFCGRGEDLPATPDWQTVPIDWNNDVFASAWTRGWQPEGWEVTDGHIDVAAKGSPCAALDLEKAGVKRDEPIAGAIGVTRYRTNGTVRWQRILEQPGWALHMTDMAAAPDGSVVVAGSRERGSQADWLVARYTAAGKLAWVRTLSAQGEYPDVATAVACDANGNAFVGGAYTRAAESGSDTAWCVRKYTASGRVAWTRVLGSEGGTREYVTDLAAGPAGSVFVTGTWGSGRDIRGAGGVSAAALRAGDTNAGAVGAADTDAPGSGRATPLAGDAAAVARFTAGGRQMWLTSWAEGVTSPFPTGIAAIRSGVAVSGIDYGGAAARGLAFRLDPKDGEVVWSYVQPAGGDGRLEDVAISRDGTVVVAGADGTAQDGTNYLLSWFDDDGAQSHSESGGAAAGQSVASTVAVDGAGNSYVTGAVESAAGRPQAMFVQSYDGDAGLRWARVYTELGEPGRSVAGLDLSVTGTFVYALGGNGDGMVLIKYYRVTP
jgi:hypothetical protein